MFPKINDRTKYSHSFFAERQLPSFILEADREYFLDFLNIYYEFLGWFSLEKYFDIDMDFSKYDREPDKIALKNFIVEKFAKVLAPDIDIRKYDRIDFTKFIKHVSHFYRIRGTVDSIRFMYYILFGSDSKIIIPWDYTFRLNVGYYGEVISTRFRILNKLKTVVSIEDISSIEQYNSDGSLSFRSYVFDLDNEYTKDFIYYTAVVGMSVGEFDSSKQIFALNSDQEKIFEIELLKGIISLDISNDLILMDPTKVIKSGNGVNFSAKVIRDHIRTLSVSIQNPGILMDSTSKIELNGSFGKIEVDVLLGYFFSNYRTTLSSRLFLQDGDYYQRYSYAVEVDFYSNMIVDAKEYYTLVKKMTKPVEKKMFQTTNLFNYEKIRRSQVDSCNEGLIFDGSYSFSGPELWDGIQDSWCSPIPDPQNCLKYIEYLESRNV